MFFTGVTRFSQNILDEQDQKTKAGDVDGALSELYDIACLGDDIFSFKKQLIKDRGTNIAKTIDS